MQVYLKPSYHLPPPSPPLRQGFSGRRRRGNLHNKIPHFRGVFYYLRTSITFDLACSVLGNIPVGLLMAGTELALAAHMLRILRQTSDGLHR